MDGRVPRQRQHALAAFGREFPTRVDGCDQSSITAPTLVVIGDQDQGFPATRLTDALPAGELLVLPGLDHSGTPGGGRALNAALSFVGV